MDQKAADVWKKDVWDIQALSQTFPDLRFFLGNEGKDGQNLSSQTWSGSRRRPPCRHPRPSKWRIDTLRPEFCSYLFAALQYNDIFRADFWEGDATKHIFS